MKISIIIPIYKAEKYLTQCLQTVAACPVQDMECILVNDESPDGSREICEGFVKADTRFVLVDKKNGGVSSARNAGLEKAQGEYIFFLDADDYLTENAWESIADACNQDVDFAAFAYRSLWPNQRCQNELLPIDESESHSMRALFRLCYEDSALNMCWGKLFRRSIIDQYNICFDESLPIGEDYKFVAQYVSNVKSALLCQDTIVIYRQHGASAMRKYDVTKRMEFTEILYRFQEELVEEMNDRLTEEEHICIGNYYLRVLTNLCREFHAKSELLEIMNHQVTDCIIKSVETNRLSRLKRLEYDLIRKKKVKQAHLYFGLKSRL